jgi:hypothetical protein
VTVTTTWVLSASRQNLGLFGYFSSATAALVHTDSGNTIDIPSSRVEAKINSGSAVPFDQIVTFSPTAAGRTIFTQSVTPATAAGTRNDTLDLNINLATFPVPADVYTGTLRLRAQGVN